MDGGQGDAAQSGRRNPFPRRAQTHQVAGRHRDQHVLRAGVPAPPRGRRLPARAHAQRRMGPAGVPRVHHGRAAAAHHQGPRARRSGGQGVRGEAPPGFCLPDAALEDEEGRESDDLGHGGPECPSEALGICHPKPTQRKVQVRHSGGQRGPLHPQRGRTDPGREDDAGDDDAGPRVRPREHARSSRPPETARPAEAQPAADHRHLEAQDGNRVPSQGARCAGGGQADRV
mmetsp:Transcript_15229/g.36223  ORF Transcript_15229/g.36223 Transcript_15229/m.36223 type:complete len:230 (+) Transcript_15229:2189-2878(+)